MAARAEIFKFCVRGEERGGLVGVFQKRKLNDPDDTTHEAHEGVAIGTAYDVIDTSRCEMAHHFIARR